eukprot:6197155-Pleurochrysis_carterae.AAC.1
MGEGRSKSAQQDEGNPSSRSRASMRVNERASRRISSAKQLGLRLRAAFCCAIVRLSLSWMRSSLYSSAWP